MKIIIFANMSRRAEQLRSNCIIPPNDTKKDDESRVLFKRYFVRVPADYDGLLCTVLPQHLDYAIDYIAAV